MQLKICKYFIGELGGMYGYLEILSEWNYSGKSRLHQTFCDKIYHYQSKTEIDLQHSFKPFHASSNITSSQSKHNFKCIINTEMSTLSSLCTIAKENGWNGSSEGFEIDKSN